MMKRKIVATLFVSLMVWSVYSSAEDHAGTINISGSITDSGCTVSPQSESKEVNLGTVAVNQFKNAGESSTPVKFTIDLTNCSASIDAVEINFEGETDSQMSSLLAIPQGEGMAQGIGVAIMNKDGMRLPLKVSVDKYPLTPGADNSLVFYAQYVATGAPVKAGTANADATFILTYS